MSSAAGLGDGASSAERLELLADLGQPLVGRDGLGGRLLGPLPGHLRLGGLLKLEVDVAEVLVDGRVAAASQVLDGLLQRLDRLLELAALEQDPAEAIEISGVLRLLLEGLADHRLGLLQVLALIGVEVAQVVVHPGLIRISLKKGLQFGLALGEVAQVDVDHRETRMRQVDDLLVVRVAFEEALVEGDRLVVAAELRQDAAVEAVERGVGGVVLERVPEDLERLVELARLAQESGPAAPALGVIGVDLQRLAERLDRPVVLVGEPAKLAQECEHPGFFSSGYLVIISSRVAAASS